MHALRAPGGWRAYKAKRLPPSHHNDLGLDGAVPADLAVPAAGDRRLRRRREPPHLVGHQLEVEEVKVAPQVARLVALRDDGDALLHCPAERDLRAALVVGLANSRDEVTGHQGMIARGRARAAERREGHVDDALALAVLLVVVGLRAGAAHADVVLHLVQRDGDGADGEDVVQLRPAVVRDADGAGLPRLRPALQRQPLLLPELRAALALEGRREVHQEQVHEVQAQLAEALVRGRRGRRGVQAPGDLRRHEVLLAAQAGPAEGLGHPRVVLVDQGRVDVAVAEPEGLGDGAARRGGVVLPGADAHQGHPHVPPDAPHGNRGVVRREAGTCQADPGGKQQALHGGGELRCTAAAAGEASLPPRAKSP
mmetsp:Transcript_97345/g.308772  ORF Transcript_97345/g.308772 Transcript_97345/m.308772 type:complete len:368 (-) Transcript_97345:2-1105(-)